jgi:hypothetical protein
MRALALAALALAGCAAPPQATLPPSPSGCYWREPQAHGLPGLLAGGPRYTAAPCNVINANAPTLDVRTGGGGVWAGAGSGWSAGGVGP